MRCWLLDWFSSALVYCFPVFCVGFSFFFVGCSKARQVGNTHIKRLKRLVFLCLVNIRCFCGQIQKVVRDVWKVREVSFECESRG